ncbi:hypothetical protein SKAU_G00001900 [Synaphobranchus kaupii]|uniref:glutathione transferase n=1 Tax=Synaphobranchus kaupii TaxID=118154 RepID=A0A9Q1GA20_SYNKA|nr:hypothetical protein SKAU_G00001900 [Synaphobranchus kaupii]
MAGRKALEVYMYFLSQPCRAVHIFLNHNKIPHTVKLVDLRKGEHKTPEFARLNPMQTVPVMVDNGFVLTESDAILKYLATNYDVPEHWYPRQPEKRARVDEYTAWHHTNTRAHASRVFIIEVLMAYMTGQAPDPMKLEKALADLSKTLEKLEDMFLKRQAYLCGEDITLADLLAICELMQLLGGNRDILKERPKLVAWKTRVQSALNDSFEEGHKVLYRLRDKSRAKLCESGPE